MSHIHFTILCVLVLLLNTVMRLVSGQMGQVARMAPGQHARRFHSALSPTQQQPTSELLALWIDSNEVEKISGLKMEIHIIKGGLLTADLQDPDIENKLPTLPSDLNAVRLKWVAQKETFRYKFSELKSLSPDLLYNPLLNIPSSGNIPKYESEFEISIPCTKNRTGTGALYIVLEIFNSMHRPLNGSPLKFRLKKRCLGPDRARHACGYSCKRAERCADAGGCHCRSGYVGPRCDQPVCTPACQNGGVCLAPNKCQCPTGFGGRKCDMEVCHCENGGICMEHGTCRCLPGFIGARCQHHKTGKCELLCKNGGHCNQLNKCTCPSGYTGHLCQRPLCSNGCDAHGKCVAPDQCQCFKGWKGNKCNKTEKMSYADNDESAKRRRKRRKLRQSEEDGVVHHYHHNHQRRSKTTSMPGLHVRHNQSNNKRNNNINNNRRNNNQDNNYRNGFQNKISNNDTFKHDHAFNNPVNKAIKNKQLYLKNLQTNNNKSAAVMRGESFVNHRVKKNQVRDRKNNYARSNDNNNNNNNNIRSYDNNMFNNSSQFVNRHNKNSRRQMPLNKNKNNDDGNTNYRNSYNKVNINKKNHINKNEKINNNKKAEKFIEIYSI